MDIFEAFQNVIKDERKELGFPGLIDFGSCNVHPVHGPFEIVVKSMAGIESETSHEGLFRAPEKFACSA